ncbi:nucleotidyltransferase family protein [Brevundimonas sp. NPDC092305]|uniref:nucleotidyltransferase family protein n=1 Tax=Brevundimonas sp. NPDC092305 TaxID=3363957 RepID=UPI003815ADD2
MIREPILCLQSNPELMTVLAAIRSCALPQGAVFAGAVYQTIWNGRLGLEPTYGVRDYDVMYFDDDLSWEAEDRADKQLKTFLPQTLAEKVEVRNQARVHLWFGPRFGYDYPALADADDALNRALATVHAVNVRLGEDDSLQIAAPLGFDDIDAMIFRAGPGGVIPAFVEMKARHTLARWPQATFDPRPWEAALPT